MTPRWSIILRRFLAYSVDWLVFAVWGGLLFAVVMLVTAGQPQRPSGPWMAQAVGMLAVTLPFTLYFALCECSKRRATLGKHLCGLEVRRRSGEPLSFGRAFARNALKFLPWECGHMAGQQASFSGDTGMPIWVWVPAVVSVIGPLWWVISLVVSGDTPYDRWVDARITRKEGTQHTKDGVH